MPRQRLQSRLLWLVKDADQPPTALTQLERAPVVIEIVPRHLLRPTSPGNHQVVALRDSQVNCVNRRRCPAKGFHAEPMPIDMQGMYIMRCRHQTANDNWI